MTKEASLSRPGRSDGPAWAAARWIANARDLELPDAVIAASRTCLIDWFACTLGGTQEPILDLLRRRVQSWAPTGSAPLLTGGTTAPIFVALLHSTTAHTTDFDDTRLPARYGISRTITFRSARVSLHAMRVCTQARGDRAAGE